MCGRITQKSNPKVLGLRIATLIEPLYEADAGPRYNGAPGQQHWVIRQHPETGARHLDRLWWGLIPSWVKEAAPKVKPINATAERVATAPMFRRAYARRRCLVPVDSFFEWGKVATKGPKQPYAIAMKSSEPFALAGGLALVMASPLSRSLDNNAELMLPDGGGGGVMLMGRYEIRLSPEPVA